MAKNPTIGDDSRAGAVKNRSQVHNPEKNAIWVKRNPDNGKFMAQKADPKLFKGVRKEK